MSNYIFHPKIGEGGMATVFMAEHRLLGNKVAIKVLNKEFVGDRFIRSRFISEAKKLATMRHPHIVQVTDLIDTPDMTAYVMEFIEGQTLGKLIREKGKLNDQEVSRIMSELLSALAYVHAKGFIHRDIKPDNVLLTVDKRVKLGDFGIAKDINSLSVDKTGTGLTAGWGTPRYMSPEQVTNLKDVTVSSDIYSTGVVLWEMVSGQRAFNYPSYEIPTKVVTEPLPLTNTKWDGVIQVATTKNPEGRFQNANAFLSAIAYPEKFSSDAMVVPYTSIPKINDSTSDFNYSTNKSIGNKTALAVFLSISVIIVLASLFFIVPHLKNWLNQKFSGVGIVNFTEPKEMVDADGNKYAVTKIGDQLWITSNLRTTKYANGDAIPHFQNNYQWIDANEGGYCYYENETSMSLQFGNLYNWLAVNDPRGLCPEGWRVPTEQDYAMLDSYLESQGLYSGAVKGNEHWNNPNVEAQNYGGLNILPGGKRWFNTGKFRFLEAGAYYWTSTSQSSQQAKYRSYAFDRTTGKTGSYYIMDGFSCRCVYDNLSTNSIDKKTEESIELNEVETYSSNNIYLSATANSTMKGMSGYNYEAQNVIDSNMRTWWSPKNGLGSENWIQIDFGGPQRVVGFKIHGGSHFPDSENYGNLYYQNLRLREGQVFFEDGTSEYFSLSDIDTTQTIMLRAPRNSSYLRVHPSGFYSSSGWDDLCISELLPLFE